MLQGTPGVDTAYDMRGDGIKLRGFQADVSVFTVMVCVKVGKYDAVQPILNGLKY